MLSLASYRYRNVLEANGGPIKQFSLREFPVYGRPMTQANVWLVDRLIPARRRLALYSDADGTGTHAVPMVARHLAVSEALERWAFHATVHAVDRELYGFDVDESTNGMAAFPGVFHAQARKHAMLEAVERASVIAWWEGLLDGVVRTTDWPGINAVVLPSPIDFGVTVIAYRECWTGTYAYGYGAAADYFGACERAVMELARQECVLNLKRVAEGIGEFKPSDDLFERRALFFSSAEGYELFQERLQRPPVGPRFRSSIVCDTEIRGPWSQYASVWRVLVGRPEVDFLVNSERYFYW